MKSVPMKHGQRGAALVVGLLLLVVLTLLAISGMNTASLELVMAGNTQFQQNAFQAAETGIERSLVVADLNPSMTPWTLQENIGDSTTNEFSAVTSADLGGAAQPAMWGSTWDSFSTYHFRIVSTGSGARNAVATNTQGVAVIAPADSTVTPDPNHASTVLQ